MCGKVDSSVVRDPSIPLGPINYGENICFFNSIIRVLYWLPLFRNYINKLRPPVKGVAIKSRKLFRKIETSNEPVKDIVLREIFKSTRLWPWDAIWCSCSGTVQELLENIYPNINDDCMFNVDKIDSILCNDCGHTTSNDGVCIVWSLQQVECYISLWIQGESI